MATLPEILSPVWTLSTTGGGAIAEGLTAIRQCIDIIIRTTKGSDPLRPTFGSDVYKYQDKPVTVAIPSIKKSILDAIGAWEPRVKITYIKHTVNVSQIIFDIGYLLVDQDLQDNLLVNVTNGGIYTNVSASNLILRGYFPPNPKNYNYSAVLTLNNEVILPLVPDTGFATLEQLYAWIQVNWVNYGQWYIANDSIVGFIRPQFKTGSFEISVLSAAQFKGIIPVLPIGYKYDIQITVDGVLYENTDVIQTTDGVRQFAQDTLNALGTWVIVYAAGDFNEDFSDDFDVYEEYLAISTDGASTIVINISTITI